jgi:hypothetical protein
MKSNYKLYLFDGFITQMVEITWETEMRENMMLQYLFYKFVMYPKWQSSIGRSRKNGNFGQI